MSRDIFSEEDVDGLDVHHEVSRLGRSVPESKISEPDADWHVAGARQVVGGDGVRVDTLQLEPDLRAAQLERSQLVEHYAHVQGRAIPGKADDQATAMYEALKLQSVILLEQFLGLQVGIGHPLYLPDAGLTAHRGAARAVLASSR
jgi:hypothetical protein